MSFTTGVAPLRISNEAFLVAATIERCPPTMMLRELVMNALEAAAFASDAPKQVRVTVCEVEGTNKLCIWNTGPGLLAQELLQISDLSSSLHKNVSLDGNFGMGAKAASLTSNRHGLRYRSCCRGVVSQLLLGQRDGVYGRVLQASPADGTVAEVIDVTEVCRSEAIYDLSHDWTEVVLLGNSANQDTARDPYAGAPAVDKEWVEQTVGRRFLRISSGVSLQLAAVAGGAEKGEFQSAFDAAFFDRVEKVALPGNVTIHYCYRAPDSTGPQHRVPTIGLGAIAFEDELYDLVEGNRWRLEAPSYGLTFAARHCTILVELGHGFPVRPEQYRQFLRSRDGDQHQVKFADFGSMVRDNIPFWLRQIIEASLPQSDDDIKDIKADLQQLLLELGIKDPPPPPAKVAPDDGSKPTPPKGQADGTPPPPPKPPKPVLPTPPEIIKISDEDQIVEKALGGRAARFYPASRQVFVNTRYATFARLTAQLRSHFAEFFSDPAALDQVAQQVAEWALIRRLSRALIHTLAKSSIGWPDEEVRAVQAPGSMSIMVDDLDTVLPAAMRRMATQLGLEGDFGRGSGVVIDPSVGQAAADLADAEAQLQRAMAADIAHIGPFYRQVALVLQQQRNPLAARTWLEKGIAVDPEDPWCHYEIAGLQLAQGDLVGAKKSADAALNRAPHATRETFLRRLAQVEQRLGNPEMAQALLEQAAEADLTSPWALFELSGLKLSTGELSAAASVADAALARSRAPSATLLRRRAEVATRAGDRALSKRYLADAMAADPTDPWNLLDLSGSRLLDGDVEGASQIIDEALSYNPSNPSQLLRRRSEIELRRGNRAAALAAARSASEADPTDPWVMFQVSSVLLTIGDLDGAEQAIIGAIECSPIPSPHFLRRRAEIDARRKNHEGARSWLKQAMALDPKDPWSRLDLAAQLLAVGDLAGADVVATEAHQIHTGNPAPFLQRRSEIASRRGNTAVARDLIEQAVTADPSDAWCRFELSRQLLAEGDLDRACTEAEKAAELSTVPNATLYLHCGSIEGRRKHPDAARKWFDRAIAIDPADPQSWKEVSGLLMVIGDLEGAQHAAEEAVRLGSPSTARTPGVAREAA